MSYANRTSVSPEATQQEIKRTLQRYGADQFGMLEDARNAAIVFRVRGLSVRITITLPPIDDYRQTPTGRERKPSLMAETRDQDVKARWRALLLAIKAKLEAVESGISTLETEFMPFVVLHGGRTVAEVILPQLTEAAGHDRMPKLLPMFDGNAQERNVI